MATLSPVTDTNPEPSTEVQPPKHPAEPAGHPLTAADAWALIQKRVS